MGNKSKTRCQESETKTKKAKVQNIYKNKNKNIQNGDPKKDPGKACFGTPVVDSCVTGMKTGNGVWDWKQDWNQG